MPGMHAHNCASAAAAVNMTCTDMSFGVCDTRQSSTPQAHGSGLHCVLHIHSAIACHPPALLTKSMPQRVVLCCAERCISNCISTVYFAPCSCMLPSDKLSCHTQQQSPGLLHPATVHSTIAPSPNSAASLMSHSSHIAARATWQLAGVTNLLSLNEYP
jgi:hypothetical protein